MIKAAECFRKAIGLDPRCAHTYLSLAFCLVSIYRNQDRRMEILEESVNAIEMAKKIDPTMPALYAAQGRNFIAEGNYARALEQFQKSLDLVPGSPVAIYYIGICYIYLGDWDKAIENLNKRSEMDIKEVQPDLRLAMIYDYLRNYPNAIKYYDRVAGFNPAHVFAPFGLADISMKR